MENRPDKIVVHHDGVSRVGPSFDIINKFHEGRDFPLSTLGFHVGYHYWIERDGSLIQARAEGDEGAHTVGQNFSSIGIGLAGNFDEELPTPAQRTTLAALLSRLCGKYGINADHIFPHRRFATKTCYGRKLNDVWAACLYLEYEITRLSEILKRYNALRGPQKI